MELKEKNIGVLMGGLSPEREVSLISGDAVLKALKRKRLNGVGIDVDNNIASTLQKKRVDLNIFELSEMFC